MTAVPLPESETERLNALYKCQILDTPPEPVFDELTQLASYICATPIAYISLIDAERQWLKSKIGSFPDQTSRDESFCAHCILQHEPLVVEDTLEDKRFATNPFVTSEPSIRFYAGFPLVTSYGLALGSLCVMDYSPRELNPTQVESLVLLGRQVVRQLEVRSNLATLSQAISACKESLSR